MKDKKLRYEDALNSVRSALELGIVPGGGACLQYLQRMGKRGTDIFEGGGERIVMHGRSRMTIYQVDSA